MKDEKSCSSSDDAASPAACPQGVGKGPGRLFCLFSRISFPLNERVLLEWPTEFSRAAGLAAASTSRQPFGPCLDPVKGSIHTVPFGI